VGDPRGRKEGDGTISPADWGRLKGTGRRGHKNLILSRRSKGTNHHWFKKKKVSAIRGRRVRWFLTKKLGEKKGRLY